VVLRATDGPVTAESLTRTWLISVPPTARPSRCILHYARWAMWSAANKQ
jgi:hypothetical protein